MALLAVAYSRRQQGVNNLLHAQRRWAGGARGRSNLQQLSAGVPVWLLRRQTYGMSLQRRGDQAVPAGAPDATSMHAETNFGRAYDHSASAGLSVYIYG